MVVISTTAVPDHVRGALTRWLTEPAPGLYVGTVSARVREGLWSAVAASVGEEQQSASIRPRTSSATSSELPANGDATSSTLMASSSYASPPRNRNLPPKPAACEVSSPYPRG